jgi:patatin-like phospholipase/acyl hydrolase
MRYLILALDGGGARLLLQWTILKRIIAKYPDFLKQVTVFSGTSAGSILASTLACGMEKVADDMITFEKLHKIFERTTCQKIQSLCGLVRAKYDNYNLRKLVDEHFGNVTFEDVPRALFIPAFAVNSKYPPRPAARASNPPTGIPEDIQHEQESLAGQNEHIGEAAAPQSLRRRCDRWHSVFYHNLMDTVSDTKVSEAIMRSTAAPTYFPLEDNCVDGGVVHNNPSLATMSHLLALGIPAEEIYILSLGTGELPRQLQVPDNSSLGVVQWLSSIIDMIMEGNQEAISQSCFQMLGRQFHRVAPVLTEDIPLDAIEDHAKLIEIGEKYDLTDTFAWIDWIQQ